MLEELSTTQLENCIKDLSNVTKYLNTAIAKKHSKLIALQGKSDLEVQEYQSYSNPEEYYCFRLLDKGISIVYDNFHFKQGKRIRTNEKFYHIRLYNFEYDYIKKLIEYLKNNSTGNYVITCCENFTCDYIGDYLDFGSVLNDFKHFVFDYLLYCGSDIRMEFN